MVSTPQPISPRKQPLQGRSRVTYDAVLQACAQLLVTGGVAAITTNRLAELAGVSVGSLYQYFPNKAAILAELVRALRSEMLEDIETALQREPHLQMSLAQLVDVLVRASLMHHVRNPALAMILEKIENELPLAAEDAEVKQQIGQILVAVLTDRGIENPHQAAQDLTALSGGIAHAAIEAGEADFEHLAQRICWAALGYLQRGGAT